MRRKEVTLLSRLGHEPYPIARPGPSQRSRSDFVAVRGRRFYQNPPGLVPHCGAAAPVYFSRHANELRALRIIQGARPRPRPRPRGVGVTRSAEIVVTHITGVTTMMPAGGLGARALVPPMRRAGGRGPGGSVFDLNVCIYG